jgi:channel protein (hemolysin III family)
MAGGSGKFPELVHLPGLHEPFSAISHLLGAAAFVILGFVLVRRGSGDRARMAALGIYACACVLLLSTSGVYHMLARGSGAHRVMGRLDHGAIFVLIAGTFTPTLFILFRGWLRWGQLVLIWAAAITALTVKMIYFDELAEWLGLSFYLTLGWFGGAPAILLARRYGFAFVRPLLGGGLAYSIGGVIDLVRWPTAIPGVIQSHEVAHVAVLAGVALHWRFIRQFASVEPPSP